MRVCQAAINRWGWSGFDEIEATIWETKHWVAAWPQVLLLRARP